MEITKHRFKGVYQIKEEDRPGIEIATVNLSPGTRVYGERIIRHSGREYRIWDPYRSKLSAAIHKGLSEMPISPGSRVLYLGAASGTTASHVSDIIGEDGKIFCVEMSSRTMRELITLCERRKNMIPILGDARKPWEYSSLVGYSDVIYQDVAQPDQAKIALENAKRLLKPGGFAIIAIKSRSIDVTKDPREIFKEEVRKIERGGFEVIEVKRLDPFEKDHAIILGRFEG